MTYEKAIEILESRLNCAEYCESDYVDSIEAEVVKLAIEALQKQIPMKPIEIQNKAGVTCYRCRKCTKWIGKGRVYCDCGQRILWEDEE